MAQTNLQLRPLQVRAVRSVHAAMREHRRIIAVADCGFGKRYLAVWWFQLAAQKQRKAMFVTHRRLLIDQMSKECETHNVEHGVIMGDRERNDDAANQICSLQTLVRRGWRDRPKDTNLIIVDECHHESANYATLFDLYPRAKVVGLTASPVGSQGTSLIGLYDTMVQLTTNSELIAGGWLLRTQCWAPSEPDVEGVSLVNGSEFSQKQLGDRVESCTVFADVFKWWMPFSDMQTICFVPRVKFAYGVAEQFEQKGFLAEVIEAKVNQADRDSAISKFKRGEIRVLVSVDVLREGFDAEIAQCGIDLQPNAQMRTFWQKVGRIKRPHAGQTEAVWLDFAGNVWRHPHPDEDPPWDRVNGQVSIQHAVDNARDKGDKPKPWVCPSCNQALAPWQRVRDNLCPNCQQPIRKPIRRIRMKDGRMKVISAERKKKAVKSREQRLWDQCRYKAFHCGKTMNFARWLYTEEAKKLKFENHYPSSHLKYCPEPHSGDWNRLVKHQYPWMGKKRSK